MTTYTNGFEIPFSQEFGITYAAKGNKSFSAGFEIPLLPLVAQSSYSSSSNKSYSNGFEIPFSMLSSVSYSNTRKKNAYSSGFETGIFLTSSQKKAGDTAFEIVLAGVDSSFVSFPLVSLGIEVLYPITPTPVVDTSLHASDSKDWSRKVNGASKIYNTLKIRIHKDNLSALVTFIKANKTKIVTLNTPSIYPFGNKYVKSNVYITKVSIPVFEKPVFWIMDITFLQLSGLA